MKSFSETIAAICTPNGKSGIGIIRISGQNALQIVAGITRSKYNLNSFTSTTRKFIHARLLDKDRSMLDESLVAIMPPQRSYTGELSVELHCHGGSALLAAALDRVLEAGARLAEPGEFTRRAVINGRMDLIQAEAVNGLINARTNVALKIAQRQFDGGLSGVCNRLRKLLVEIKTELSAAIDIEDDGRQDLLNSGCRARFVELETVINYMLESARIGQYVTAGFWITIFGPANAGKSSIFNKILKSERAIVSDKPGTTRDHISESMNINGFETRITDTAGIRNSDDEIERMAIGKSLEQINVADLLIYVVDQNMLAATLNQTDFDKTLNSKGIVILNKCDLGLSVEAESILKSKHAQQIIPVSAKTGFNLDKLKLAIEKHLATVIPEIDNPMITSERQIGLLLSAKENIESAQGFLNIENGVDRAAFEIQTAIDHLDSIIGVITDEEIMDNIFKNFCVGK